MRTADYVLTRQEMFSKLKEPIRGYHIGSEADFEGTVWQSIGEILECLNLPPAMVMKTQARMRIGNLDAYIMPDIAIRHVDETMTVMEVKKVNNRFPSTSMSHQLNGIGQLLLYGAALEPQINAPVRLILIDTKIFYRTYLTVAKYDLPITLMELNRNKLFIPYWGWDNG